MGRDDLCQLLKRAPPPGCVYSLGAVATVVRKVALAVGALEAATMSIDKSALDDDWRRDCQGFPDLDYHRFSLAWFQLADQVTLSLSP